MAKQPSGRWTGELAALALLAGCGAGAPLLEAAPSQVEVTAVVGQPAPLGSVRVDVSQAFQLQLAVTRVGVAGLTTSQLSLRTVDVLLTLRAPETLGPGTYQDVLTLRLCPDAACASPRASRQVQVRYRVLPAPTSPDGGAPVLASLTPAWVRAGEGGDAGLSLLVTGGGFGLAPVVRWDGQPRPTAVRSESVLVAALGPEDLAATHTASVTVALARDGGVSAALPFRVFGPGAPPVLVGLTPSTVEEDGPDVVLRAVGQGLVRPGRLELDGVPLSTLVESTDVVTALAPGAALVAGTHQVVLRGAAGDAGLASGPLPLVVVPLPPVAIQQLLPERVPVGSLPFILTVRGAGFGRSARLFLDGTELATTVLSTTELKAPVPAAALTRAGALPVTVTTQAGTSPPVGLAVERTPQDAVTVALDPAHTGVAHLNALAFPAGPRWQVDLGGVPSYPLVAEGLVFVTVDAADGGALVALDRNTGATRWGPVPLPGPATPAYQDGVVVVLAGRPRTGEVELQAFQADAGTLRWRLPLGTGAALPPGLTPAQGLVFFELAPTTSISQFLAVRVDTGELVGVHDAFSGGVQFGTAPAVTDTLVQVHADRCHVQALSGSLGFFLWTTFSGDCAEDPAAATWPVVAGGVVYAALGNPGGGVLALNTGFRLDSLPAGVSPAVDTSQLYLAVPGWTLSAYPLPRAGQPAVWSFTPDAGLVTAPVVVNTTVFAAGGRRVHAVDALTGVPRWSAELPAPVLPPHDGGLFAPLTALGVGQGLLLVPAGTTLTAFTLSDDP